MAFATHSGTGSDAVNTAVGAVKKPAAVRLQRGKALFFGGAPLQGKPRDHSEFLSPAVVRCGNCHASGKLKLDPASLIEPRERRGGPPSSYAQADFCRLLRTGVDPASVMIDHGMPIYEMPERDCASLWTYITHTEEVHNAP